MTPQSHTNELLALKTIAETLNTSNEMVNMLDDVLKKLLEVTGLTTGWIFLVEDEPEFTCVTDHNLPPALIWKNKSPMCSGACWCLEDYWSGDLKRAVNIINCKRIQDSIKYKRGDTNGILRHATVPLEAGGKLFGILNVAAPGKETFTEEELALLQAVAYQIGTAINRTRLYQIQQKRAESYAKLGEISQFLATILESEKIPSAVVEKIGSTFDWKNVSFFQKEGDQLSLRANFVNNKLKKMWKTIIVEESCPIGQAYHSEKTIAVEHRELNHELEELGIFPYCSGIAIPVKLRNQIFGVLWISSEKRKHFDEVDHQVLQDIADQISLAFENARLYEHRRELDRMEERNRLARDLHDSVCQTLFSLNLIAKGTESVLEGEAPIVTKSLHEIQELSHDALKEMRTLIWQLRPVGLEQGLLTALKRYGESLGIEVKDTLIGLVELPRTIEEALWRIGQEALNNISKHTTVLEAFIELRATKKEIRMVIRDNGQGFVNGQLNSQDSMGMISMRERTEILGGILTIHSQLNQGTEVEVRIPLN